MKAIHLFNPVNSSDLESSRRYNFAASTWSNIYEAGVIPCPVETSALSRSSKDIGDSRELPFIKDLIHHAMIKEKPDVIIFTNADICFFPGCSYKIDFGMQRNRAIFAKRINFNPPVDTIKYETDIPNGKEEEHGVDLVGFRVEWWKEIEPYFPDLLLGCEQWDSIFQHFINITNPYPKIPNVIYHEEHDSYWRKWEHKNTNLGQVHNIQKSRVIHPILQIISHVKKSCANPSNDSDHHFLYWVNQLNMHGKSLFDAFIKK